MCACVRVCVHACARASVCASLLSSLSLDLSVVERTCSEMQAFCKRASCCNLQEVQEDLLPVINILRVLHLGWSPVWLQALNDNRCCAFELHHCKLGDGGLFCQEGALLHTHFAFAQTQQRATSWAQEASSQGCSQHHHREYVWKGEEERMRKEV